VKAKKTQKRETKVIGLIRNFDYRKAGMILLLSVVPAAIVVYAIWLVASCKWMNNPMGYCVNIVMGVSSWIIFSKEIATRAKNSFADKEFRLVDCMTIILTVITVCYSFLQIANPPISINHIIKLIIWFCLIVTYTILAKPTRMKVLYLCLVAALISTLFVLPATHREYYENELYGCLMGDYYKYPDLVYDVKNDNLSSEDREGRKETDQRLNELLEDEYFKKGYKNTLYKNACDMIDYRTETQAEKDYFTFHDNHKRNRKIYMWWDNCFVFEINTYEYKEDKPAKLRINRVAENGFSANKIEGVDDDGVMFITYEDIKGLSGYKNITLMSGFAETEDGIISCESEFKNVFLFYGYDILIAALLLLLMVYLSIGEILAYLNIRTKKYYVIAGGFAIIALSAFAILTNI